uniref:Protein AMBP n=1 Tax=Strix occidentalis caurina TaxID=311401 RepID=A0A8D0FX38_STROC
MNISALQKTRRCPTLVERACGGDVPFFSRQMYGKWYDIAIGTTCIWMKNYKEKFSMGTLVLGPGTSTDQISTASTRLRQGDCTHISGEYQKTSTPGKYTYYNPKWDVSIRSYVLRTNYEEYAVILMKKKSSFGPSTTLKLYGRSPDLREDLIEAFQQLALEMGIPADSIFILANRGRYVPGEGACIGHPPAPHPPLPVQPIPHSPADSCRLSRDPGPCSGMLSRFFYNSSSMACETFLYGGCLGNGNNFYSEKECLQACRTEEWPRTPRVQHPCGRLTRWAFDAAQGKCIMFSYGGCKGNGNQFYSEKECKEYCGAPPLVFRSMAGEIFPWRGASSGVFSQSQPWARGKLRGLQPEPALGKPAPSGAGDGGLACSHEWKTGPE